MEPHHPEMTPPPSEPPVGTASAPTGTEQTYRRLLDDAALWDEDGRDESYLYHGRRLALVERDRWRVWREDPERHPPPGPTALAFLDAAREHAATRAAGRLKAALAGVVAIALVLAGATTYALWTLDRERDASLAAELIQLSRDTVLFDGSLAQLLAAAAWRLDPGDAAWTAMTNTVDAPATGLFSGGHGATMTDVAFSPDGTLVATGAVDGSVALWDTETWTPVPLPELLSGSVEDLQFSSDGTRLAASVAEQQVLLWDLRAGTAALLETPNSTTSLAFDPAGAQLVAGGGDGILTLWDAATGEMTGQFDTGQAIEAVAFDRTGADVVVGGYDGVVRALEAGTWTERLHFNPYPDIESLESLDRRGFDSDDFLVCSWGGCGMFDHTEGGEWSGVSFGGSYAPVVASLDGTRVLAPISSGGIGVWDAGTGAMQAVLPYTGTIGDLAVGPDGSTVVAVVADGLQLWDLGRARMIEPLPWVGEVDDMELVDDEHLISTGEDGTAYWDLGDTARPVAEYPEYAGWAVAAHPSERIVATGVQDAAVVDLWNPETGTPIRSLAEEDDGLVTLLEFSPDGRLLGAGRGGDGGGLGSASGHGVTIWNHRTGQVHSRLEWASESFPVDLDFSPDGTRIATLDAAGQILVWDVESGEAVAEPGGTLGEALGIEYHPDGDELMANGGGPIAVWDTSNLWGAPRLVDTGYSTYALAFGPGGQVNAAFQSVPDDPGRSLANRLALWHPDHEGLAASIPVDQDFTLEIAVTGDGRTIVMDGLAGISMFDVGFLQEDPYRLVCEQAGRELTAEEWEILVPEAEQAPITVCER